MSLTITAFSSSVHSTPSSLSFFVPNHDIPVGRVAQGAEPFSTQITFAPLSAAMAAAGQPEMPAPMTSTSQSTVETIASSGTGSGLAMEAGSVWPFSSMVFDAPPPAVEAKASSFASVGEVGAQPLMPTAAVAAAANPAPLRKLLRETSLFIAIPFQIVLPCPRPFLGR